MKLDLRKVQHECHGRFILKLIKENNLGSPRSDFKEDAIELADRIPVPGEEYYYYNGPMDTKNRPFCHDLLVYDKVFSLSEIDYLTSQLGYDVLEYQGSYGCRHAWIRFRGTRINTPKPTANQMRVLTAPGQPYTSPYKNPKTYTNY